MKPAEKSCPVSFSFYTLLNYKQSSDLAAMSIKSLRWGILGCGLISGDFVKAMESCEHPNKVSLLYIIFLILTYRSTLWQQQVH